MNLEFTLQANNFNRAKQANPRMPLKDLARSIHGASKEILKNAKSKEFVLVSVPIRALAVIESSSKVDIKATSLEDWPIIVDVNKNKLGNSVSGYTPKVIVIEGAAQFNKQRLSGKQIVKAWVGAEAMKLISVYCDDQFGSQELNDKIQEQLREKYKSNKDTKSGLSNAPIPWVQEVYPFEDYFVYNFEGKLYRQNYKCDTKKRTIALDGDPIEVIKNYKDIGATAMDKAIALNPIGNKPKVMGGKFISNATAPGTGVGPNVGSIVKNRATIFGGGPGSGRHPGESPTDRAQRLRNSKIDKYNKNTPKSGEPVNKDNHVGLTDNGYKYKGNIIRKGKELSVYENPQHYGSRILVHESGRTHSERTS